MVLGQANGDRGSAPVGRLSLPQKILQLRENSLSLFVFNIPESMSKTELEATFCRDCKILDSFIPLDKISGKKRGFAFVCFGSFQEAKIAMEMALGRSWTCFKQRQSFTTQDPTIKIRSGSLMRQEKNLRDPVKSAWADLFKTHEKNLSPQSKKGWVSLERAGCSRG